MKLPGTRTPNEAAAYLSCSRTTLFKLIHSGQLRAVNIGLSNNPRWAIADEDLAAFVRRKLVKTPEEIQREKDLEAARDRRERRIIKVRQYV